MRMRLSELAEKLGLPLHGDGAIEITGVAGIREAHTGDLTFLGSPEVRALSRQTRSPRPSSCRRSAPIAALPSSSRRTRGWPLSRR